MSKVNTVTKAVPIYTAEGARAARIGPETELRRSVAACLLWEDSFYESGESIADRIKGLVPKCRPEFVAACAYEARTRMNLRHVPLLLVAIMAGAAPHARLVSKLLPDVVQRADELAEFVAIYAKINGVAPGAVKKKLSAQVKAGLAKAFQKFNEYALAKYNRDGAVKLRDILFLCHAKPKDAEQDALWKRLIDGKLETPDTWEVSLSGGADKKATFERLMLDGKLGALAFLRNLRNMQEAGVTKELVSGYASAVKLDRILPFRYVAAAKFVPAWEDVLDGMLLRSCENRPKMPGKTVVIVDASGSMQSGGVSAKSDMSRLDAAGALAAILRESCEDCRLYATAGSDSSRVHATMEVPARRGMALVELFTKNFTGSYGLFYKKLGGGGIFLKQVMDWVGEREGYKADRVIVLTDEQDCDIKANPKTANAFGMANYLLNVSVEKNGIGYGKWTQINGFSEAVLDYVREVETQQS